MGSKSPGRTALAQIAPTRDMRVDQVEYSTYAKRPGHNAEDLHSKLMAACSGGRIEMRHKRRWVSRASFRDWGCAASFIESDGCEQR